MIALNEIISNKKEFEKKYRLMGKRVDLDKIVDLEQKFITDSRKSSELRANCNKLCSQVADEINIGSEPNELIKKINKLDRQINKLERKNSRSMRKINRLLSKLPNLALSHNTLNLSVPTIENPNYTKATFLDDLAKSFEIFDEINNLKMFYKSLKNVVMKAEILPKLIKTSDKKTTLVLLCNSPNLAEYETIVNLLKHNSKYLIEKSIKSLNPACSKEFLAILSNNLRINVALLGEYVSRGINLKFYDKNIDMTKFLNMVLITIE